MPKESRFLSITESFSASAQKVLVWSLAKSQAK